MSRGMIILLICAALAVVSIILGCFAPAAVVFHLLFGWVYYVGRVIPSVRIEAGGVVLALLCLVGVAVLGHWLAGWLWREMQSEGSKSRWKVRWTAMSLGVVLLMFICGIAATGVVHQVGWLVRSEERLFSNSRFVRHHCASNMRQIGLAVQLYAEEGDGQLPDSLAGLESLDAFEDLTHLLTCPTFGRPDYIYYGRGQTWPVDKDIPILAEPLGNHEGEGMNILFGDGSVRFVDADEAQSILARRPR